MRRLANGCTSESHPLYGPFMSRLSAAIFEWDRSDLDLLFAAKRSELITAGVPNPPPTAVQKAVSKEEIARHCRRRTRGTKETVDAIVEVLLSFSMATDTLGVPVLKEEMKVIWAEQVKHVACIQDPPGVQLYTVTGNIKKGCVTLPILRCARGSTSLESFHLHLARFVPGSPAGAVNFQAYILDGICRWNSARAAAAVQSPTTETLRTFNSRLQNRVNQLSQSVLGEAVFSCYQSPSSYTSERFGVQYLYYQTGRSFTSTGDQLDAQIDEGFADVDDSEELLEGTGLAMLNINLTSLVIIIIQYYCSKVLLYYIRQELLADA